MSLKHHSILWLIAIETLATAGYLAFLPGDPKNSILLGLSAPRLAMISFLVVILAFLVILLIKNDTVSPGIIQIIARSKSFMVIIIFLMALVCVSLIALLLPPELIAERFHAYLERLQPFVFWLWLVSLECLIYLTYQRYGFHYKNIVLTSVLRRVFMISILVLAFLWILIAVTGLGQTLDPVGWRELGTPLLAWQFWLSLAIGLIFWPLERKLKNKPARFPWMVDLVIIVVVYCLAVGLWSSQPLPNSYFSPEPRPPNSEVYPYSDAIYYNLAAESVTIGEGLYGHTVTPRPLFLAFLAIIVNAARGDYSQIIFYQTFLLAFIPVILYFIGKHILGRPAGIAIGLMAILREMTAITATSDVQLSNSRLLMADLPALLMVLLFTLTVISWLKGDGDSWIHAALAGGSLGLAMLVRTQVVILVPFILIMVIWQFRPAKKTILIQSLIFITSLILVVTPWVIRNAGLTGKFIFDDPFTQTDVLQSRYQVGAPEDGQGGSILSAVVNQPGQVLQFVLNHFLRNEIGTVFVTPPQRGVGTWDLLYSESSFWRQPFVSLTPSQGIQLAVILIGLALGIGSATARWGLPGLVPLLINLAYTLGNGLARNSSGRYNLPVDWIGYFYLTLAVFQLAAWIQQLIGKPAERGPNIRLVIPTGSMAEWQKLTLAAILLLMVGSFIPLVESVFPERYQPLNTDSAKELMASWQVTDRNGMLGSVDDPVILYGRELFPRFYKPGVGEQGSNWVAYAPLDFCRMGFVMVGADGISQVIVTLDKPPQMFPNRMDAIVIGTKSEAEVNGKMIEFTSARWIILHTSPVTIVEGLTEPPQKCRLK